MRCTHSEEHCQVHCLLYSRFVAVPEAGVYVCVCVCVHYGTTHTVALIESNDRWKIWRAIIRTISLTLTLALILAPRSGFCKLKVGLGTKIRLEF